MIPYNFILHQKISDHANSLNSDKYSDEKAESRRLYNSYKDERDYYLRHFKADNTSQVNYITSQVVALRSIKLINEVFLKVEETDKEISNVIYLSDEVDNCILLSGIINDFEKQFNGFFKKKKSRIVILDDKIETINKELLIKL